MKINPNQRSRLEVRNLPIKKVSVFPDESALKAFKLMAKEKIRLVPLVDRKVPHKIIGVVTIENIAYAYEKTKSLH